MHAVEAHLWDTQGEDGKVKNADAAVFTAGGDGAGPGEPEEGGEPAAAAAPAGEEAEEKKHEAPQRTFPLSSVAYSFLNYAG